MPVRPERVAEPRFFPLALLGFRMTGVGLRFVILKASCASLKDLYGSCCIGEPRFFPLAPLGFRMTGVGVALTLTGKSGWIAEAVWASPATPTGPNDFLPFFRGLKPPATHFGRFAAGKLMILPVR